MTKQNFFDYKITEKKDKENFFVNKTNINAFELIIDTSLLHNIFLFGPKKSGKSHLASIWQTQNNALIYNKNFSDIIDARRHVVIDDSLSFETQEEVFHIINHCKLYQLRILLTSSLDLNNYHFTIKDLFSRLKSFYYEKINNPDDEMCKILMTKLFYEKQIIVNNKSIFDFILNRITRTYNDIYAIVKKIDNLSLEKKRQLTIPLIKEIL